MGVRSRLHDLTRTPLEQDADDLHRQSVVEGGDDLRALAPRHPACVCGTVRTVTLPPRSSVPALVAEVWDGKGSVNLVLGRPSRDRRHRARHVRARARPGRDLRGRPDDLQPRLRDRPEAVTADERAPEAPTAETVEALIRHRLSTALGGWRGSVETALPTVVFVGVWSATGHDVRTAAIAAIGVALVLAVVRVLQRSSLQHVLGALVATAVAAFFALRSGEAQDAFLPGILTSAGFFVGTVISVLVAVAGRRLHRRRGGPAGPGGPVRVAS